MLRAKRINDNLVVICESHKDEDIVFCMQLVIGDKKAALIDAGNEKNPELIDLIRSFTTLPVGLYLTHGHRDHIGNAEFFNEIHIGKEDAHMLGDYLSYTPLSHGEEIDLGGIVLEAYALSGHTKGAFCFMNKNDGYALTGDIINRETWLCWDSCDSPSEYTKKVSGFYETAKEYNIQAIFEGHTIDGLSPDICNDMIHALKEISDGCVNIDEMHHMEGGKIKNQHSYGNSTIIYDKERMEIGKGI